MAQTACGDEHIRDAHWRSMVEEFSIDAGGASGAFGIKGQALDRSNKARYFDAFIVAIGRWRPLGTLEKFELSDDLNKTLLWGA